MREEWQVWRGKKGCGVLVILNWPPRGGSKSVMTEVLNVFCA